MIGAVGLAFVLVLEVLVRAVEVIKRTVAVLVLALVLVRRAQVALLPDDAA